MISPICVKADLHEEVGFLDLYYCKNKNASCLYATLICIVRLEPRDAHPGGGGELWKISIKDGNGTCQIGTGLSLSLVIMTAKGE